MIEISNYLEAFSFILANSEVLERLGWTLAASIIVGALLLDRFKLWFYLVLLLAFLGLMQWQIDAVSHELGLTHTQIMIPHVVTVLSGLTFVCGVGIGYTIKKKCTLAYTKHAPVKVANDVVTKVNGGETGNSNPNQTVIFD